MCSITRPGAKPGQHSPVISYLLTHTITTEVATTQCSPPLASAVLCTRPFRSQSEGLADTSALSCRLA
eukprot:1151673-Pelagomonas_calceolata.AAC.11